jgi:hypothetical protein
MNSNVTEILSKNVDWIRVGILALPSTYVDVMVLRPPIKKKLEITGT